MARFNPFEKRRQRVRTSLRQRAGDRPRLSVHRSGRHIYAQVINDAEGRTVAAASTLEKEARANTGATVASAQEVGKRIAERAKAAGIEKVAFDRAGFAYHGRVKALAEAAKKAGVTTVVFDRGGFLFHGRVKALADAAREGGLEF